MASVDISQQGSAALEQGSQWVGLDDVEVWSDFSEAVTGSQWGSRFAVEGMHCAACGFTVEKAVQSIDGVISAEVNATSGRARIVWDDKKTKPSALMQAIHHVGYQAFPQVASLDLRRKQQRQLLWRWLVAGFCMMQVMMYTYPTYFAAPGEMAVDTIRLLRWAAWVLTLPVMFFSSTLFFSNAYKDLKQRRISMDLPVTLGILITFCVSTAGTFQPDGWWGKEVYFDSLTMFIFFLLTGRWLEARMRNRTAGALEVLMRRLPSSIERQNSEGDFIRVALPKLQVGDVLRIFPGEAFPVDGTIILGSTSADEALLTGESAPVNKALSARVIAGSYNLASTVQIKTEKIGTSTQYAQIVALMERVSVDKPRLALLADKVAKPFLILVLFAAAGSALMFWQVDHSKALMAAVAVLIVTCPCALSLATPAAMLSSVGALAKTGLLARRMQALEAITTVDTIIFDKTGTLTSDHINVVNIETHQTITQQAALQLAASMAQHSLHPVSRALFDAWDQPLLETMTEVEEVSGAGLVANTALGQVKLGSARFCDIASQPGVGMQVYMANEHGLLATFSLEEDLRKDAKPTINRLLADGYKVIMLSGDQLPVATLVANKLGIKNVMADCTPQDKLDYMQDLQQQGKKIIMVGDGLNDGPVLAGAHVSVAMGKAVPLAQAQSDFVIQSGQLALLPQLFVHAKKTIRVVKQNLIWAGIYNAVCVPFAVLGYLPAWLAGFGMAASSLVVILNALRLSRIKPLNVEVY
ncbi:MAG: cation-translocating P-type ATPase [Methylophilaceae bacterium]